MGVRSCLRSSLDASDMVVSVFPHSSLRACRTYECGDIEAGLPLASKQDLKASKEDLQQSLQSISQTLAAINTALLQHSQEQTALKVDQAALKGTLKGAAGTAAAGFIAWQLAR